MRILNYAVLLALVLGVGCGGGKEKAAPKTDATPKAKVKTTPKVEAKKTEPTTVAPSKLIANPSVERKIRGQIGKPKGELTKADLEKVTRLSLENNQLTDVKGLEKLTQLTWLDLFGNKLTDVKGLEKLTKLEKLILRRNPDLTKAQIDELQKALPECKIEHDAK